MNRSPFALFVFFPEGVSGDTDQDIQEYQREEYASQTVARQLEGEFNAFHIYLLSASQQHRHQRQDNTAGHDRAELSCHVGAGCLHENEILRVFL